MKGPGGCSSVDECINYCESHGEECQKFGEKNGPPPAELAKQFEQRMSEKGYGNSFLPGKQVVLDDSQVNDVVLGKLAQKYAGAEDFFKEKGLSFDQVQASCTSSEGRDRLTALVFDAVKQEGGVEDRCAGIKEGISSCEQYKTKCQQFTGTNNNICPADEAKLAAQCKLDRQKNFESEKDRMKDDLQFNCLENYIRQKKDFTNWCSFSTGSSQSNQPRECNTDEFMRECVERAKGQAPFPQPDYGNRQCPDNSAGLKEAYAKCTETGGQMLDQRDQNGCSNPRCSYDQFQKAQNQQQPPNQPQQACPAEPSEDAKQKCYANGGSMPYHGDKFGCRVFECITNQPLQQNKEPNQPTPNPTYQATTNPTQGTEQNRPPSEATATPEQKPPVVESTPQAATQSQVTTARHALLEFFSLSISGYAVEKGFNQGLSPDEICRQQLEQIKPEMDKRCDQTKQQRSQNGPWSNNPWGLAQTDCTADGITKEVFISKCSEHQWNEQLQRMPQASDLEELCTAFAKKEVKRAQQYCQDSTRGQDQCLKNAEEACSFANKQYDACKNISTDAELKQAISKVIDRECRTSIKYANKDYKAVDSKGIANSNELIPVIIAAKSEECTAKIKALSAKVEGFQTLADYYIINARLKASSFAELKKLDCVVDAKIDQATRALESQAQKPTEAIGGIGLEGNIAALEFTKEQAGDDLSPLISVHQDSLAKVSEGLDELGRKDAAKGFDYKIQQFLGGKAADEKKEALAIREESQKLGESIASLKKVAEQINDPTLQAVLLKQVEELNQRKSKLDSLASDKEKFAGGIIDVISKLGGLLG